MRAPDDKKTADLLPDCDLAGPIPPKPTAKELNAARVQRFRDKHGVKAVTVQLPVELADRFDAWAKANGKNKSAVIAKLIASQLLRKR